MKREKGYVILGVDKAGKLWGIIENSFSMGVSDTHVNVHSKCKINKYYYEDVDENLGSFKSHVVGGKKCLVNSQNQLMYFQMKEECKKYNIRNIGGCEWKVYRINSRYCPVEIDFSELIDMKMKKVKYDKWKWRNQPFKLKTSGESAVSGLSAGRDGC